MLIAMCRNNKKEISNSINNGYFRSVDLNKMEGIDAINTKEYPCVYFNKTDSIILLVYYLKEGYDYLKLNFSRVKNLSDSSSDVYQCIMNYDRADHFYEDKWVIMDGKLINDVSVKFKPDTINKVVTRNIFEGNKRYYSSTCSSEKQNTFEAMNLCLKNYTLTNYNVDNDSLRILNSKDELIAKAKIGDKFYFWQALLYGRTDVEELKFMNIE
jgi:hypothetical protein